MNKKQHRDADSSREEEIVAAVDGVAGFRVRSGGRRSHNGDIGMAAKRTTRWSTPMESLDSVDYDRLGRAG